MDFTRSEIEEAALVLVVQEDGAHRWSSTRSDEEVARMLEEIAAGVRQRHRMSVLASEAHRVAAEIRDGR